MRKPSQRDMSYMLGLVNLSESVYTNWQSCRGIHCRLASAVAAISELSITDPVQGSTVPGSLCLCMCACAHACMPASMCV